MFIAAGILASTWLTGCLAEPSPEPQLTTPGVPAEESLSTATPTLLPTLSSTPVLGGLPTPQPAASVPPSNPCDHLLWPLGRSGATWTYRLITLAEETEIVLASNVTSEGVTLTAHGQTSRMYCGDASIAGLPPLPVAHPELGFGVVGINPVGDYLPAPAYLLPLGHVTGWDQELDAGGAIRLPFVEGGEALPVLGGKLVLIQEAGALETIRVPTGEFLALPVHQDVFLDLQLQFPDGAAHNTIVSATVRHYYVEGVGLIKVSYDGGMVSTSDGAWPLEGGAVLELVDVSLP